MVLEMATAGLLCLGGTGPFFTKAYPVHPAWPWANLLLVVLVWAVTFFVQVPQHNALTSGFSTDKINHLVAGNWWRTWLWTIRMLLVLAWLSRFIVAHPE